MSEQAIEHRIPLIGGKEIKIRVYQENGLVHIEGAEKIIVGFPFRATSDGLDILEGEPDDKISVEVNGSAQDFNVRVIRAEPNKPKWYGVYAPYLRSSMNISGPNSPCFGVTALGAKTITTIELDSLPLHQKQEVATTS